MAKDFAKDFYNSPAWKSCRASYARYKHYLCERCFANGIFRSGDIVHHKIALTPANITDPDVALSFENLELLCRGHHAEAHKPNRRFTVDDLGRVIARSE